IPAIPSSVSSPPSVPAQDQGHSGWPSEGADCSKEETTSPAIDDSGSASAKSEAQSTGELQTAADLKKRNQELEQEVAGLWQMCEELHRELAAQPQAAAAVKAPEGNPERRASDSESAPASEPVELERRLRASDASC